MDSHVFSIANSHIFDGSTKNIVFGKSDTELQNFIYERLYYQFVI